MVLSLCRADAEKKSKHDNVSVDTMKAIWEFGSVAPLLLYRDTRQAKCPLYPHRRKMQYPLNRVLGET
jgi:hypothetical protein